MMTVIDPVLIVLTFLWIGFVCAISFMEAGLKFRAPGVTIPVGLSIGRVVFGALNKVEWVLAAAIVLNYVLFHHVYSWNMAWIAGAILILKIQTLWMLPALSQRAKNISEGVSLPPSSLHRYYLLLEVSKVAILFVYGVHLFH
ncbi:hypothetical protein KUV50_03185 [Membranicola marinus]|uniref:Transmembrane protein n=1 Tax=Membranihabitans marinus TaxID=1227546 RepID=A0A953HRN9_9BACT|nr:hypothetical protein [Membranihabitans marinus]MBY5957125.1 hypothetical protein [Membranihabitans marinus]